MACELGESMLPKVLAIKKDPWWGSGERVYKSYLLYSKGGFWNREIKEPTESGWLKKVEKSKNLVVFDSL